MKLEVDSDNFEAWLDGGTSCENVVFQALDLRSHDDELASLPQARRAEDGCVLLGCGIGPRLAEAIAKHHGLIFPVIPGRPYKAFRPSLYTAAELFQGFDPDNPVSYFDSSDWRIYKSYIKVDANNQMLKPMQYVDAGADEVLARRLHDHFIENETDEFLQHFKVPQGKGIVAIMGGHDRLRTDPIFADIAKVARQLTREGFLVASGGGPGLMEASNLGAYFAAHDDAGLDAALAHLGSAPSYKDSRWLATAWEVVRDFPSPDLSVSRSFGVPTWFYGHEPPNVFATHIAKYFENSLREEGLLAIATHGVIFAEGNG
ncbi:MAG: hypothetical protein EOP85_21070, partial [Verrucomicrobiaceae bacterium]